MGNEASWKSLLDKFSKRLSNWKARLLSISGRLTLCKAVLRGLGVYLLSLFKVPTVVLDKLERMRRNFLAVGPTSLTKWPRSLEIRSLTVRKNFGLKLVVAING